METDIASLLIARNPYDASVCYNTNLSYASKEDWSTYLALEIER